MSRSTSIAFIGASGGCGLAALKNALAHSDPTTCIALCRTPAKLTDILPPSSHPNLIVKQGNAHSVEDVESVLRDPKDPTQLVDAICFSIGSVMDFTRLSTEDPHVCERGVTALLQALSNLRSAGDGKAAQGRPRICVISTTGIAAVRDVPLLMWPLYHFLLGVPHKDKAIMEEMLRTKGKQEEVTVVRPSLLTDGARTDETIRVGVEDLLTGERESEAVGYTISREDVGAWIWEHVLKDRRHAGKAVAITY